MRRNINLFTLGVFLYSFVVCSTYEKTKPSIKTTTIKSSANIHTYFLPKNTYYISPSFDLQPIITTNK